MPLSISTEGLAHASARRPWIVVGVWAAVVVASVGLTSALLAGALGVDKRQVELASSPTHPRKEFRVAGLTAQQVRERLAGGR